MKSIALTVSILIFLSFCARITVSAQTGPASAENGAYTRLPVDIINGIPLYVEYAYTFDAENTDIDTSSVFEKQNPSGGSETIVISYDGRLYDFRIDAVSYEPEPDRNGAYAFRYQKNILASGEFRSSALKYTTSLPEGVPCEVISFSTGPKERHEYLLRLDGKYGLSHAYKAGRKILERPAEMYDFSKPGKDGEAVEVSFYDYQVTTTNGYDKEIEITSETVYLPAETFLEDAAAYYYLRNGIGIDKIWYEGSRICVDLYKPEFDSVNAGSYEGTRITQELLMTFGRFPDVEKIEILIGGERGRSADYFDFSEPFKAAERYKTKRQLTETIVLRGRNEYWSEGSGMNHSLKSTFESVEMDFPLWAMIEKEDIFLYGIHPYGYVLYQDGYGTYFEWAGLTPSAVTPEMQYVDFDGDGKKEIAVTLYVASGTGFAIMELHVLEIQAGEDGYPKPEYIDFPLYSFELGDLLPADMAMTQTEDKSVLQFTCGGESTLIETDREEEQTGDFLGMPEGFDIVHFAFDGDRIKVEIAMGVQYEREGVIYLGDLTADVVFDGENFALENYSFAIKEPFMQT
ncbi:MAG: hypothetical protein LBR83_04330 [Clostridiales bacterium]|jgi:hypothetical protein|nr:hypothetical protein [Clostridiales bacterium]